MRRLGELSRELEKAQPTYSGVQIPSSGKLKSDILEQAGISTSTAQRAEILASIPEAQFEERIEQYIF